MLAKARSQTADPRVTFAKGDLAQFKPDLPPSILYSNAAYHWLEGHIDMFPGLLKLLPSGGQLAIQMPRNHEAPSHALMRGRRSRPLAPSSSKVRGIRPVFEPARYYDVLKPLCSDLEVWESIYQQPLTGKDPVAQYTAGTGLRPYMQVLDEAEGQGLLRHLRQAAGRGLSDARRRHHALSLPPPVHRGAPRMRARRPALRLSLALLFVFSVEAPRAEPQSMVAAANPLAVDAGLEALRKGGSAVDAAVAVQMVLGVVEPQASGLGGGGFLLYYDGATRAITVYDGRETAPAGATPTMFLDRDGKPLAFARPSCRAFPSACRARWRCSNSRTRSTASGRGPSSSSPRSASRARALPFRRGWPPGSASSNRSATSRRRARSTSTTTARPRSRASASPIRRSPTRCG